jgi:hypothetical protein
MITFTELEIVLGFGIAVVLYVNRKILKELERRIEERYRMIDFMRDVADEKVFIKKLENGVAIVKENPRPAKTAVPPGESGSGDS